MAPTTVKLSNRSPKQPIKKLPETIEFTPETTVEELKKKIAAEVKIGDHNRIGLFDPSTKKTLKNRKAKLSEEPAVAAGELLVKDLGLQIDWKTVFVIEYIGPIFIHIAALLARPYLYKNGDGALSPAQWLSFAMIELHFVKREVETLFVHKFSANTMPARNIFKNSFFYWAISGALAAYSIYSPTSFAAEETSPALLAVGSALYLFGEVSNAMVHLYLSTLRSKGGTERKIPVGYGFGIVTCPNYMYEVLAWAGVIVVSRSWPVVLFIASGIVQMVSWAKGKERAYRKEFGDSYKKKRYVMLPGLL